MFPSSASACVSCVVPCWMLLRNADRCSSVLCNCCTIAAAPGSSLGLLIFLPLANSFCTSSKSFCVRASCPPATCIRSVLLTRASCKGRMAIASDQRQNRLHHFIHRGHKPRGALKRALLLHQVDRFLVHAHAAERLALRFERLLD